MLRWLAFGALLVPLLQQPKAPRPEAPRDVVWMGFRAVEGDSAPRLRARWSARIARDSADRAARLGLATLARLTYDYPVAERTYTGLIRGSRDGYAVYAHLGLAEGFEGRGMDLDARRNLDQALDLSRAIGDRTAESQVLIMLAFSRGRLAGHRVAEATIDSARRLIPDTAYSLQAQLRNRMAIVFALQGRPSEGSAEANAAIALAKRAGDRRVEAVAWRVAGQLLQYRGQWDSALYVLRRSESLYVQTRNRSALASSLIWHAQVLGSMGRYGEMRKMGQRALVEGEASNNPDATADAHRIFGVLASMFGDLPGAAEYFRQSAATSIALGDSSSARTTRKYQAMMALAGGDVATAKRVTLEMLEWAERTNYPTTIFESQRLLADIAEREGDTAAVSRAMTGARAQLPKLPGASYRVWLLHDEARHALARGDLVVAARQFEELAAGKAGAVGNLVLFDARVRLADIYGRQGDVARAERELTSATDEIDAWRSQLPDDQLRKMAFQVVATIDAATADPGGIAESAARVLAKLAGSGRVETSFALAERWRARVLMESLARTAALREDQTRPLGGSLVGLKPRSAGEVTRALDERTALVEFVAAASAPVTVFVVQRSGISARVLGAADSLAEGASRFRTLLESGADATRLARALGAQLLDPVLALVDPGITRLVIIPDGALHRVAFDALRLGDDRYLVQRYAIGLAPSASVVTGLRAAPAANAGAVRLLAMGDPTRPPSRNGNAPGGGDDRRAAEAVELPRLKGASREARRVAQYAEQGEVRLGRNASADFLTRTDLRPYRVLHFATHAIVNEQSIAGTALVLAPGGGSNGFVGAGDLAALRLGADMVVLSSCTSAGGTFANGEGVQGLTSSFLQAGARVVVATGWKIRDEDVVPLVDRFYAGLARGLPVIEALQAAKLGSLESGSPARTWAAFLAVGDPLVSVPLREPRSWWQR